jgi:hypothetical protein
MSRTARLLLTGSSILAVIIVVVVFIVIRATKNSGAPGGVASSTGTAAAVVGTSLAASVITDLSTVPVATLDAVGAGKTYEKSIMSISGSPLTSGSKPGVVYIGAGYCPFCAAERWAIVVALSRFGTFSGLRGIHSSSTDVYPGTATLTFYHSAYTSKYLDFTPVEVSGDNPKAPLQKLTSDQQGLFSKYDAPPYVAASDAGAIPFLDLGNKYLVVGAQYDPQVLQGSTWTQVAAALKNSSAAIAQGVDGAANILTAAVCKLTGGQPADVCTSPAVRTAQAHL